MKWKPKSEKPNYLTLNSRLSAADLCRKNGWTAGAIVCGTETWPNGSEHTCHLLITAIGENTILGKCLTCGSGHEGCWTLTNRDWRKIAAAEVPKAA